MRRWLPYGGAALTVLMMIVTGCSPSAETAVVQITGNDQMQYNIDRFEVKAGQTVRIELSHIGQLDDEVMGHNVVVLKMGENPEQFAMDVLQNGGSLENDYVPQAVQGRVIAHTEVVGGGESTSIEFTAPAQPGDYPFLCTFPAHVATMKGVMVVTP